MAKRGACTLLILVVGGGMTSTAHGACFEGLGFKLAPSTPGNSSEALAVSADGSVIVGRAVYEVVDLGINGLQISSQAVMWRDGVAIPVVHHALGSGEFSTASGISADGSVIVGTTQGHQAWRWEAGVATDLDPLPTYDYTIAGDVSADGSVVIGLADDLDNSFVKPVRWDNGVVSALDLLPGVTSSGYTTGVSDDGSVVVGYSATNASPTFEAVRWQGGVIQALGFLTLPTGTSSYAYGVSANGLVAVGNHGQPFRWAGGTMTSLGPTDSFSRVRAADADGSVLVGNGGGAKYWTAAAGVQSLADLLTSQYGLDLTGWYLSVARDVSSDGNTIVGSGINPNGKLEAFIANLAEAGHCPASVSVPTSSPSGLAAFVVVLIATAFIATRRQRRQYAGVRADQA